MTTGLMDLRQMSTEAQRNRNKGADHHRRHSGLTSTGDLRARRRRRLTRRGLHALVLAWVK